MYARLLMLSMLAALSGCPKECEVDKDCPGQDVCHAYDTPSGPRRYCAQSVRDWMAARAAAAEGGLGVKEIHVGTGGVDVTLTPGGR